jgi:glycosyltransferase involved in cell wall biosynthesis
MKILIVNQAFYPDVVATAQKAADLASHLAAAGHEVTVLASNRAYDQPALRFAGEEYWRDVRILRTGGTGWGKGARWKRLVDFGTFWIACLIKLFLLPRQDLVLAMTSPPLIAFPAALFVRWKGGELVSWIMDLNPDEAVAAGWLRNGSIEHRLMAAVLGYSLRSSSRVVVLDRFMRERVIAKGVPGERIDVIPPWAHDHTVRFDAEGREQFRRFHGLDGKFVVMYSGNHSPCHPLDSVLQAALGLRSEQRIRFCFVGGGAQFGKVKSFVAAHGLGNVLCLPYQPFDRLSASLSAADLHLVAMGDSFVGIVHPCKIYDILTIGMPCLYVGPIESHMGDLTRLAAHLYTSEHGDIAIIVRNIREAAGRAESLRQGSEQMRELARDYSQDVLIPRMAATLAAAAGR